MSLTAALAELDGALLLAIGVALRRRGAGGRVEAYLAGRRLGPGLVAATLTATAIGGSATVVLARVVHEHGLAGLWYDLPLGLALVFFGLFLARKVRASGRLSLPDLAGRIYGPGFRRALGVLVVLTEVAWFALLVRAATPFLLALVPALDESLAAVLLAAAFVAYTGLGGQAAVAWTDLVQLAFVGVLGLLVPALVVLVTTNGLAGLPRGVLAFPTSASLDWLDVFGLLALFGLPGLVGGDIWGKTLSARDAEAARTGALVAGGLKLLAAACVAVLALGHHALLPGVASHDGVLSRALELALPEALAAAATLGFLAAMMSSADSVLLTGATVLDVDLLPPPRGARAEGWRARGLILSLGAAGTLLALAATGVVAIMRWAYTVFAAGAPLPLLIGLCGRPAIPGWAATTALVAGGAVAVGTELAGVTRPAPVLFGLAASGLALALGAAFPRAPGERR